MKIRFENARTADGRTVDLTVEGKKIASIVPAGEGRKEKADRVIGCTGKLIGPAFYNLHCHAAMTLFRGYGEDMPLDRWLNEKIFPAEDLLTDKSVSVASEFAIAEMIRAGVVSFSDMYFFCGATAEAVGRTGVKANLSRSIVSFDPTADFASDARVKEAIALFDEYDGAFDGRLKIDFSLHAEYTNVEGMCRYLADAAKERGTGMQVHLSETESEHLACIGRHGKTPAAFFENCGVFDVPTSAAHCVWLSEEDAAILAAKGVTAVHNPSSNLKLGSGIMPYAMLREKGVNIALGTDGAASNNNLDVMKEMTLGALLDKGVTRRPEAHAAPEWICAATRAGALAQRREDCGLLEEGMTADLVLIDLETTHSLPVCDPAGTLLYSSRSDDVYMTMCDGKILYENGEYTTVDVEKIKAEMRDTCEHYFG